MEAGPSSSEYIEEQDFVSIFNCNEVDIQINTNLFSFNEEIIYLNDIIANTKCWAYGCEEKAVKVLHKSPEK